MHHKNVAAFTKLRANLGVDEKSDRILLSELLCPSSKVLRAHGVTVRPENVILRRT